MGLGKTLQTLSLIQSLKDRGSLKTSLLVARLSPWPTGSRRSSNSRPDLSFYRHAGSGRHDSAEHFNMYDIVIVSYHTLRNDVDIFLDMVFDYIILDEAPLYQERFLGNL